MPAGRRIVPGFSKESSYLAAGDPRWHQRTRVEIATAAWDVDKLGIGSSPGIGDVASSALRVPDAATVDQTSRYLFRLAVAEFPRNANATLCGVRQYSDLIVTGIAAEGCVGVPVHREITSPLWTFIDGNISWHLRWETTRYSRGAYAPVDPAQTPDMSASFLGNSAALLVQSVVPYAPPSAGRPPGSPVENLGTWRDMRYPWSNTSWDLHIPLRGPGRLVMYCSVRQTDVDTRCPIAVPSVGLDALGPEDRFVAAYEADELSVRYGYVAGAITLDMFPDEG